MTSLPTPLSPVIRTGIDDLAARPPSALTICMGRLSPTRSAKVTRPATCFFSRPTSAVSWVSCSALRMPTRMRSGLAGLMKKSWAPACIALTTVSMPPLAVRTMTGVVTPARPDFGEGLHPAHARHDQIQQHDIGPTALGEPVDRLAAAFGMDDGIALAIQHRLHQSALGRIVVDHQNGLGHAQHSLGRRYASSIDVRLARFGTVLGPAR